MAIRYREQILKEFTPITTKSEEDSIDQIRFRIVKRSEIHTAVLDVRQFITSKKYTGWTRKGIYLERNQVPAAIKALTEALREFNTINED